MANITILDGNQAGSVVTAPTGATSTTVIDGFTIRNGSGTINTYGDYCGGGVFCVSCSPTISNNKITGNTPELGGGAIYCELSSATISNNTIVGNRCVSGGAVCCIYSSDTVTDNTIVDNGTSGSAAGG
ncbi:MAG: DUF1565 domain-containing protein, partial [Anaerolineae bacterium]|nr:DUF1565 domain-containing protein [Anaerolineae bacterium]